MNLELYNTLNLIGYTVIATLIFSVYYHLKTATKNIKDKLISSLLFYLFMTGVTTTFSIIRVLTQIDKMYLIGWVFLLIGIIPLFWEVKQ